MRVLLLLRFILFPLFGLTFYLSIDYWNANRIARYGEGDGITVGEYLKGWVSFAGVVTEDETATKLPGELAQMMPKAPEGWSMQATVPEDLEPYLPKGTDRKLAAYLRAVVNPRKGKGLNEVRQTYVRDGQIVIVEMIRYPDFVFTSFAATAMKMELQMTSTKYSPRSFMTVRGMEFVEDVLPEKEEVPLRYFIGNVASQIWVRVLASASLSDPELLAVFQTLHVPAMNADVVEKVPGMGEVPVIVLASAMEADARAEWEAERARQVAEEAEKAAAARAEQEAADAIAAEEEADRERGITKDEETGVKVRKGTGEGSAKPGAKTKAGFGSDGCEMVDGRKVCGTAEPEE